MAKIVFFGTPDYVVPILDALAKQHEIVAVVTQPPKAMGREVFKKEQFKEYSPVDTWAHKKKVQTYFEPAKIIEKNVEADLGILESYGEFIPKNLINYFKFGILNAHPSLLPLWRGASPAQAAILAGDVETGVTIIKLDSEWDHGPIISSFKEEVRENDTAGILRDRLFTRSGEFLIDLIPQYLDKKIEPREQKHEKATFSYTVKKEDGFIPGEYLAKALEGKTSKTQMEIKWIKDFSLVPNPQSLERFIRAMNPWPGAWTYISLMVDGQLLKRRLKIIKAHISNIDDLSLIIDEVQLEGKNKVTWDQFREGYPESNFE